MKITKNTISNVYKSEQRSQFHGYNLVEELFCDSSGFGKDWEAALTTEQLEIKLFDFCSEHGQIYTFITKAGQFQVYIGVYTKDDTKEYKTFAKHKKNLKYDNNFIYSYDTKVAEIKGNNAFLSSWSVGGKNKSRTTTKHIKYACNELNLILND